MIRRLLAVAALGVAVAAPTAPASAVPCLEHPCIDICWDCIDGPYLGCYDVSGVVNDLCV